MPEIPDGPYVSNMSHSIDSSRVTFSWEMPNISSAYVYRVTFTPRAGSLPFIINSTSWVGILGYNIPYTVTVTAIDCLDGESESANLTDFIIGELGDSLMQGYKYIAAERVRAPYSNLAATLPKLIAMGTKVCSYKHIMCLTLPFAGP